MDTSFLADAALGLEGADTPGRAREAANGGMQ